MKWAKAGLASLSLLLAACSNHTPGDSAQVPPVPSLDDMRAVSPALAHNTESMLLGEVWKRPGLSPRDRSLVTLAVLISKQQTVELAYHLNLALDNGIKPSEISEVINHLAFYTGWGNATATILVTKQVFAQRGVTADQLPPCPLRCCLSTQHPRKCAQPSSTKQSVRYHRVWCITPALLSFMTCGYDPGSPHGIEAS